MIESRSHGASVANDSNGSSGMLDGIVFEVGLGRGPASKERGRDLVREFVEQVLDGGMTVSRDVEAMINARIAQIDFLISIQLNEILHEPKFQELESAWRGLFYLVDRTSFYNGVKIRVFNVSKRELLKDTDPFSTHQSTISSAVVNESFDTLGAEPFSLLLGNYSFGSHPEDMELLEHVTRVAAAAHAPFISAADASLFNCNSFSEVARAADLKTYFESSRASRWASIRGREATRFAALALPRVLLRQPYGAQSVRIPQFNYEEGVDGRDSAKFLWGNPAWAVATQVARAFGKGSWCADPAAIEGGGVIQKLPPFHFATDEGDIATKGPTEAPISDPSYAQLRDLGFVPVCCDTSGSRAVLFEVPTIRRPLVMEDEDGEIHHHPPAPLREALAHGRIAQYIKCIVREKRTWFESPEQCERYLNRWVAKYTVVRDQGSAAEDTALPFLEAEFKVAKDPRRPEGWFRVEGSVLLNMGKAGAPVPIDISVPVLLTRSAADWRPATNLVRETDGAATSESERLLPHAPDLAATRIARSQDPFAAACDALERLTALRRQRILEEPEFLQLREGILQRIKRLAVPEMETSPKTDKKEREPEPEPDDYSVPYAQLHAQIVDLIAEPYRAGAGPKQRAESALATMEGQHALNEGDSALLKDLLDVTLNDSDEDLPKRMEAIKGVAGQIRGKRNASPASRAIAETAEQSGSRAERHYAVERKVPGSTHGAASSLWRKLVWPDVEGAFSGGAAATAMSSALASYQLPWPLQIAAAVGVVIGAGVRSGVAYGEGGSNERVLA